jgi:hypothetical protein
MVSLQYSSEILSKKMNSIEEEGRKIKLHFDRSNDLFNKHKYEEAILESEKVLKIELDNFAAKENIIMYKRYLKQTNDDERLGIFTRHLLRGEYDEAYKVASSATNQLARERMCNTLKQKGFGV